MFENFFEEPSKPEKWPANATECALQNILDAIRRFIDQPNYKNKEILISLVSTYDLNQKSNLGIFRITEYEVWCLNTIYIYAGLIQLHAAKTYIYEHLGARAQMINSLHRSGIGFCANDEPYKDLWPVLKFYYWTYLNYNWNKNRSFVDQIIRNMNEIMFEFPEAFRNDYLPCFIIFLNDISYFRSKKKNDLWAFSREEIFKLFELEARIIKLNGENPMLRPLRGVLMTVLSNYVLKSRNNYNSDYICKYVSKTVAASSASNHEVWMQKIEFLNDKREFKVVPQLFSNKVWLRYDWAKNNQLAPKRVYYVSSFSKTIQNSMMETKYGNCLYGYKNDRIADLLSPIYMIGENKDIPQLGQVICFDVLYDEEEAKEEINYLCSLIDLFELSDKDKSVFLAEILQYWLLSVKDKKWSYERERRYVLFLYDEYNYIDLNKQDNRFLKLKCSLLLAPDFILGDNPSKEVLRRYNYEKRMAMNVKDYYFCDDCFSSEFDLLFEHVEACPVCQSKNIHKICVQSNRKDN